MAGADPFSAFASSFGGGLGKGVGDALGGGGPMTSGGVADMRSGFDGSGWTVSTGSSTATATRSGAGQDMSGAAQGPIGQSRALTGSMFAGLGSLPMLFMVGLAVYWFASGGKLGKGGAL